MWFLLDMLGSCIHLPELLLLSQLELVLTGSIAIWGAVVLVPVFAEEVHQFMHS